VIVPNFNGDRFLRDCLTSLRNQTYSALECLVVDDASHDSSPDMVVSEFPEMELIRLPENGGFAHCANEGMRRARGEIVALLNNDAVAQPDWVEQLVGAFQRHPEAGSVASKMMLWDTPNVFNSAGDVFFRSGVPDSRGVWQIDRGQYDVEEEVFGASGGACAYRRRMLDEIGLFDERFFMYCEDVDLAFRAQMRGYTCVYAPAAVVRHRLSATGGGALASYHCGRNFLWILARDLPAAAWRQYWPGIAATQLRFGLDALLHVREPAARARLRGMLAGLVTAPQFVRERRDLRATRCVSDERMLALFT
jgi:GT2 family glycosyltransferase